MIRPAQYRPESDVLPAHARNALIRALKSPAQTVGDILNRLARIPSFDVNERQYGLADRCVCILRLDNFWIPAMDHVRLYLGMYAQTVASLERRDPSTPEGQALLLGRSRLSQAGSISMLTGNSGMGKSTISSIILEEIVDQFIRHSGLEGFPFTDVQVSYLRRNIPERCTPRSLGEVLGLGVDNDLGVREFASMFRSSRPKTDVPHDAVGRMLVDLYTAIVVLDEFQNLSLAGVGSESVLAMLCNLHDQFPIPIHLVGTHKALKIPKDDMSFSRRISQSGNYQLVRPAHGRDPVWQQRCRIVWGLQWVRDPIPYTPAIGAELYNLTAGVTGIMITLFKAAQMTAMLEKERVSIKLLKEVFNDQMRLLQLPISYLLSNDPALMIEYDDLYHELMPKVSQGINASFPFGAPPESSASQPAADTSASSRARSSEGRFANPRATVQAERGESKTAKPVASSAIDVANALKTSR